MLKCLKYCVLCAAVFTCLRTYAQDIPSPYDNPDVEVVKNVDAQYNSDVVAKIEISESNGLLTIAGVASNKTEFSQSLRYVFTFIKNDDQDNSQKDSREERFVLNPLERKQLASGTINFADRKGVVILFLVYNENKLLGKDRLDFNELGDNFLNENKDILTQTTEAVEDYAIKGIVTEDTKTKAGRDFYRIFFQKYTLNNVNGSKIVSIKEQFSLGRSTKIDVSVDNKIVFQFYAKPREDFLKKMADVALYRVSYYFVNLAKQAKAVRTY